MSELIHTYLTNPSTPGFTLPKNACDTHCHLFGPGDIFPYSESRNFTPVDAPKEKLFALHEQLGIERCVIVQSALHGFDNAVVVDAMQVKKGTYLGVALSSAKTDAPTLEKMYLQGFRGIRFNFMSHLKNSDTMEDILALTTRMAPLGMHLQVHFESKLIHELGPQFKRSAVPVMIDHMARVDASLGENHTDFRALMKLLEDPQFHVKVSGVDRIAKQWPYTDGVRLAKILVDTYPSQCVWGTDWPHPNHHHIPDDGLLVDCIAQIADSPEKIRHIMVQNPEQFYGFITN